MVPKYHTKETKCDKLVGLRVATLWKKNGILLFQEYFELLTAGLALLRVRGKSLVPAPPPNMIAATVLGSAACFSNIDAWKVYVANSSWSK